MKWYKFNIKNLSSSEYEKYYSLMSESKKRRVDKFRFEDDKKRTVAGEMLIRRAVAELFDMSENELLISESENAKPYIENADVQFNISHSKDLVVCAVSSRAVGIDVEKIRPVNLSISKRVCSEKELDYIFGRAPFESDFSLTNDEEILIRFFELWTKKEAYAKCIGTGISGGLNITPECETIVKDGYVISIYCEK